jgi:hypothetical protein
LIFCNFNATIKIICNENLEKSSLVEDTKIPENHGKTRRILFRNKISQVRDLLLKEAIVSNFAYSIEKCPLSMKKQLELLNM